MALIRYNRNRDLYPTFSTLVNEFLKDSTWDNTLYKGNTPAVNIRENADNFEVELAVPGFKKEDFKVELNNNVLSIAVEKEAKNDKDSEKSGYSVREFSYQSFKRAFKLPKDVNSEAINARYEDGILRLDIPKKEEAKEKPARLIEIA